MADIFGMPTAEEKPTGKEPHENKYKRQHLKFLAPRPLDSTCMSPTGKLYGAKNNLEGFHTYAFGEYDTPGQGLSGWQPLPGWHNANEDIKKRLRVPSKFLDPRPERRKRVEAYMAEIETLSTGKRQNEDS